MEGLRADTVYARLVALLRSLPDEELIDVAEVVARHLAERERQEDPALENPPRSG